MSSRFLCVTPVIVRFYLDLPRAAKIEYVLWKWGVGVCLHCECVEFVTAD